MLLFVLLERECGVINILKPIIFFNFIGLRVKILIVKNCGRALKRGKNRLRGQQNNFDHSVTQLISSPLTWCNLKARSTPPKMRDVIYE